MEISIVWPLASLSSKAMRDELHTKNLQFSTNKVISNDVTAHGMCYEYLQNKALLPMWLYYEKPFTFYANTHRAASSERKLESYKHNCNRAHLYVLYTITTIQFHNCYKITKNN